MNAPFFRQGAGNRLPSNVDHQRQMEAEIRKLWQKVRTPEREVPVAPQEQKWSYSGQVQPALATAGQDWDVPCNLTIINVILTLRTAASNAAYSVTFTMSTPESYNIVLPLGQKLQRDTVQINVDKGATIYPTLGAAPGGNGQMLGMVLRWIPR